MKKYSTEEKEKWVAGWKTSGKSKWKFAREQGLVPQTFLKWIRSKNEKNNFVEITSKKKLTEENKQEIILEREELRIRIPSGINQQGIESVAALLKLLT